MSIFIEHFHSILFREHFDHAWHPTMTISFICTQPLFLSLYISYIYPRENKQMTALKIMICYFLYRLTSYIYVVRFSIYNIQPLNIFFFIYFVVYILWIDFFFLRLHIHYIVCYSNKEMIFCALFFYDSTYL